MNERIGRDAAIRFLARLAEPTAVGFRACGPMGLVAAWVVGADAQVSGGSAVDRRRFVSFPLNRRMMAVHA